MEALIVTMPERIREQLYKRAASEGKDAQTVALEILTRDLSALAEKVESPSEPALAEKVETPPEPAPAKAYESLEEREERFYKKLREEGVIVPLSDELKKMIIPDADEEQVFREMSLAGGKPLSQIVIEQRQERHDILVYGYKRARQKIRARDRQPVGKKPRSRKGK
jgi:plasmid stability protein